MSHRIAHISAGATAVFVGFSSAVVLILEAVQQLGGSPALQSSWLLALGLAMGISTIVLSWWYKAPILTAWSTPGVALLVGALSGLTVAEAVGVFIFSSVLIIVCGLSGWSERILRLIPSQLAAAVLAGILLQFVQAVVPALNAAPFMCGVLAVSYFILRRLTPRYMFFWLLLLAILLPPLSGNSRMPDVHWQWPQLIWVWPEFNWQAMLGVGLPLFIVTMASQNIPGLMMLRSFGYKTPASPLLTSTGIAGLVLAPAGAFAINLAAITAAICQNDSVDPDPKQRYKAAIAAGVVYLIAGLLGTVIVTLFLTMPKAVTATLAGLALLPIIASNLQVAFSEKTTHLPITIAFVITVADVSFFGVSGAFWALIIGVIGIKLSQSAA